MSVGLISKRRPKVSHQPALDQNRKCSQRADVFRSPPDGGHPWVYAHPLKSRQIGKRQLAAMDVHATEFGAAMQGRKHFFRIEQALRVEGAFQDLYRRRSAAAARQT